MTIHQSRVSRLGASAQGLLLSSSGAAAFAGSISTEAMLSRPARISLPYTYLVSSNTSTCGLDPTHLYNAEAYWREATAHRPRTPLARRLEEIRARIVASGQPLLTREEIEREVAERRGSRGEA